jgi:RNA polymerase sigma-70 factor (ECF subfamily)
VAQEMFAEIWLKRDQIRIHTSVTAYLKKMAISRALNYIRDTRKHQWDELDQPESDHLTPTTDPDIILRMEEEDVRRKLEAAISALPEKCRIVFLLSRTEELSYAEIAEQLQISVKTVENQIGKALRMLREALGDHRG